MPRSDGGPGRRLVPTGRPEMLASFVNESPVLALNLIDRVRQRHLPFTLVLRGAYSDLLLEETAADMASRGPKAELIEIEGCGHAPALMDEPQIALVRDWLMRKG